MTDILPSGPLLIAFISASFILAATPGPGVFYIVARSLAQGRKAGLASVAGVALGNFANAIGAAIGLGALLAVSSVAFLAVKYAGAVYLVYLGVQALRGMRVESSCQQPTLSRPGPIFRDGVVVALLNPKTAMFFAAFLPQFMSTDTAPVVRSIALGALFVLIAAITDMLYVLAAGKVRGVLTRMEGMRSFSRYFAGGAFIGLGLFSALVDLRNGE